MIVTNPPFGGMEEDGIEGNFPAEFRTRETADLFLVLVMELLKDGGRAAIVLPDGTLFGEGIKTRIKKQAARGVQPPHDRPPPQGRVRSVHRRSRPTSCSSPRASPPRTSGSTSIPIPTGYKSYSKTKPMRIEEFEPEKAWWDNREETERAWMVTAEDIAAGGYNLDITNPNVVDDGHEDPDVLLARYAEASAEVEVAREALRASLAEALLRD